MINTIDSLKVLYVALGGLEENFTSNTIPDAIVQISEVVKSDDSSDGGAQ